MMGDPFMQAKFMSYKNKKQSPKHSFMERMKNDFPNFFELIKGIGGRLD
jgi:hypothetical protein